MRHIETEELKSLQTEILKDVDRFCRDNGIRYSLAYGTLLGAVRHGGYIPWDDDIDILMPRPDYDRFISTYNEKGKTLRAVCPENTPGYGLPFAKITDTRTELDEYMYRQDCFGVYIDLFPVDGFGGKWQVRAVALLNMMINAKKSVYSPKRGKAKSAAIALAKAMLAPVSLRTLVRKVEKISAKHAFGKSALTCIFCSSTAFREIVPRETFERYTTARFEGMPFSIVERHDSYLKSLFGNYMQLPPESERVTHHTFKAWWK